MIRSKGYYKNQHHRRQLSKILRRDTAKNAMSEDVKYIDEDENRDDSLDYSIAILYK